MNKEHIISEIKRTADENKSIPLGCARFKKETGIKISDWYGKYWIRWSDALLEAGYPPNIFQSAYDEDFLIEKLIELIKELGHFPITAEIRIKGHNDKSFPSHNTFSRFGKRHELIQKIISYCETHSVPDSIINACKTALGNSNPERSQEIIDQQSEFEFVYLMKSGRYFKIGRSKSAERREFELKIQLPENLELIHKIKTDDPTGIEKYWHDRFKDKRKGGEWFDLSASDVRDFKRRKFM
jgi:hypothetical protein